jgi:membrane protease YdiL (CAAX protease family)
MAFPLFFMMMLGGGLEESGWRGVALPGFQKRLKAPIAAILLGVIWAIWHLPLFLIEGVSQYGTNFWIFSIGVLGISLTLSWFYNRTESILICVIYHAAANMVTSMGFFVPSSELLGTTIEALIKLAVGILLISTFPVTARVRLRT